MKYINNQNEIIEELKKDIIKLTTKLDEFYQYKKKIRDLKKGDEVLTHSGKYIRVKCLVHIKYKQQYPAHTAISTIYCHIQHKLLYIAYTTISSIYCHIYHISLYPAYTAISSIYCHIQHVLPYGAYTTICSIYCHMQHMLPHAAYTAVCSI